MTVEHSQQIEKSRAQIQEIVDMFQANFSPIELREAIDALPESLQDTAKIAISFAAGVGTLMATGKPVTVDATHGVRVHKSLVEKLGLE